MLAVVSGWEEEDTHEWRLRKGKTELAVQENNMASRGTASAYPKTEGVWCVRLHSSRLKKGRAGGAGAESQRLQGGHGNLQAISRTGSFIWGKGSQRNLTSAFPKIRSHLVSDRWPSDFGVSNLSGRQRQAEILIIHQSLSFISREERYKQP